MKRVLIISHNSLSKIQNNGKTLEAICSAMNKSSIAQLFFQPEIPDFDYCKKYYCISDYSMLNSILQLKSAGYPIKERSSVESHIKKFGFIAQKLYGSNRKECRGHLSLLIHKSIINRNPIINCFREFLWLFNLWDSKNFKEWIEEFSPDVIFFQGGGSIFSYRLVKKLVSRYNLPLILQLTDDYTSRLYKLSIVEVFYKYVYKLYLQWAINYAKSILVISSYMRDEYKERFGGQNYSVMMNALTVDSNISRVCKPSKVILYTGNVLLERWLVLEQIGRALNIINRDENDEFVLQIHSPTPIPLHIQNRLLSVDSIKIGDTLDSLELEKVRYGSRLLIHVEAFDDFNSRITRLSISTKIPEYFSSSKCIFAVGPSSVASIKYLQDNNLAVTCTKFEIDQIILQIKPLLMSDNLIDLYSKAAYEACLKHHNVEVVSKQFLEIVNA